MKMKHNFNFYITSYILCCLSLVACPSPLSDTSESVPPSTDASSECDESCQSDEVCHLGQCATPCGQLGEPCPKNFSCSHEGFCVNYILDEVYVPAGEFWMGCNPEKEDDCDASEQHRVSTPSYFIHRHEFTEAMSYHCERGECPLIERRAQSPMKQVTHTEALEECERWGYELCSEAQWEKAAKGGCETVEGDCKKNMRTYPWGDEAPSCERTVWGGEGLMCNEDNSVPLVNDKNAGASPYGALDMAGNANEWVYDCWNERYDDAPIDGTARTTGCSTPEHHILRGGNGSSNDVRASRREAVNTEDEQYYEGFRCCRPYRESDGWEAPVINADGKELGDPDNLVLEQVTDDPFFGVRQKHVSVVWRDTWWLLGGAYGNNPYTDGFTSEDGRTWENLDALQEGFAPNFNQEQSAAVLNDALYIIGRVTSKWTQDGTQWYPLTQEMSYDPEPFSYTGQTVLARYGLLWMIGAKNRNADNSPIWASPNGSAWYQMTDSLEVAARFDHTSVIFNDRMWVMGGQKNSGELLNDVWSSADGINWRLETAHAAFSPRSGHASVVFQNHMWVIGGQTKEDASHPEYTGDLWYSADGIEWKQPASAPSIPARAHHTATAFKGRLWITGQYDNFNDIWVSAQP